MNRQSQLFFVLGRGRSGSWLLTSILNCHPEICCAPEALFIVHLERKYRRVPAFQAEQIRAFVDDIWTESRMPMWWRLDKTELYGDLLKKAAGKSFADVCLEVYAHYARTNGIASPALLGDKNPTYTLFIQKLAGLFPQVKFVCLVRDYRDNILSFQQVGFDLQSTSALAYRWNAYHREISKCACLLSGRFLIVRYEDLLLEPRKELERVCSFLGVSFLPQMLEFHKQPKTDLAWNEKIKFPIDAGAAYRWKSAMKQTEIEKADYICGELAQEFGYEVHSRRTGARLWLRTMTGKLQGAAANVLEKLIFRFPMKTRMRILNSYRKRSGTLEPLAARG